MEAPPKKDFLDEEETEYDFINRMCSQSTPTVSTLTQSLSQVELVDTKNSLLPQIISAVIKTQKKIEHDRKIHADTELPSLPQTPTLSPTQSLSQKDQKDRKINIDTSDLPPFIQRQSSGLPLLRATSSSTLTTLSGMTPTTPPPSYDFLYGKNILSWSVSDLVEKQTYLQESVAVTVCRPLKQFSTLLDWIKDFNPTQNNLKLDYIYGIDKATENGEEKEEQSASGQELKIQKLVLQIESEIKKLKRHLGFYMQIKSRVDMYGEKVDETKKKEQDQWQQRLNKQAEKIKKNQEVAARPRPLKKDMLINASKKRKTGNVF